MAVRYTKEQVDWLVNTVDEYVKVNQVSVDEAVDTLLTEWQTRTGRTVGKSTLSNVYYRHKRKAVGVMRLDEGYQIAPGNCVVVVETGKTFAQVFPDMESAIKSVNGRLADYTFLEASKLRVGLRMVTVVEKA